MEKKKLKDKWVRIIGVPVTVVLMILTGDSKLHIPLEMQLIRITKLIIYVFLYWEANRIIFIYLRNKYPHHKETAKKIIVQLITFIIFIVTGSLIVTVISSWLPSIDRDSFWDDYFDSLLKSGIILGIITICYECAYFFVKWENSLYESERLKKEQLISQFELLKTQISPHFLFNSLNALMALIPEDTHLSILFIQKLSNVYRYMLNYSDKHLIGLDEEMDFLRDYLFLYQIRFGENLVITYNLPVDLLHIQVVPFSLQMLVENSIKHNVISNRKPLHIHISSDGKIIVVKNNLQKKTSGVESTNTGLKNIINRYRLLTKEIVAIEITKTEFSVSLPLFSENNNI